MKKLIGYIIAATFLFSTMEIVLKSISGQFNPVQLTFTRFLIGGIVLLPFALRTLKSKGLKMNIRKMMPFAFYGFIGIVVSMTLYQLAIAYTEASIVAVLFSSQPVFVLILSYLLLKEQISANNVIAFVFVIIGIICIINPFNTKLSVVGIILALLSAILFALYGVCGKKPSNEYGGLTTTCFSFLWGASEMILAALVTHIPAVSGALVNAGFANFAAIPFFSGYSIQALPSLIYVCIGVTGIGFACYFMAIEKSSASTASLVFVFKAALAPVLAFLILGEQIPANKLLGILLILLGSVINLLPVLLRKFKKVPLLEK